MSIAISNSRTVALGGRETKVSATVTKGFRYCEKTNTSIPISFITITVSQTVDGSEHVASKAIEATYKTENDRNSEGLRKFWATVRELEEVSNGNIQLYKPKPMGEYLWKDIQLVWNDVKDLWNRVATKAGDK